MEAETNIKQPVCWNQGDLHFELRCEDAALLARGHEIFRYWRMANADARGETCVMSITRAGEGWSFSGSQTKESVPLPDVATVMRATELAAAQAILDRPVRFVTVHGALLAREGDAVLIVGPSHSGKSTLSCALWAAGWQLLSDDVTILEPDAATACPLLRRVSLRHGSRELLGDEFWQRMTEAVTCDATPEGFIFHPDEIEGCSRACSARLVAILFLNRRGVVAPPPAALSRMTEVEALLALSPYTNTVRHLGLGECMARLGGLMNRVPCYDFGRGPLPMMIETVNNLLDGEALTKSSCAMEAPNG